jgi:hypothetical protein
MKPCLHDLWNLLHPIASAAMVTVEVAVVGLLVSWQQYRYMKRRDREIDIRGGWTETHKLMMTFRFKREIWKLNLSTLPNAEYVGAGLAALESFHNLKGQVDRLPDGELVEQIADFLHENSESEKWMSDAFEESFDGFARQVASLTQPAAHV